MSAHNYDNNLCNNTFFYLDTPFLQKNTKAIQNIVLNTCPLDDLEMFNNLDMFHKSDDGFQLPLTYEWKKIAPLNYKITLKYHDSRQLQFIEKNGLIIGMALKDGINYMTEMEMQTIQECIEDAVKIFQYN